MLDAGEWDVIFVGFLESVDGWLVEFGFIWRCELFECDVLARHLVFADSRSWFTDFWIGQHCFGSVWGDFGIVWVIVDVTW
jgi:hypothetical protein